MAGSQQSIINEWRDRAIEEGGQVRLPHSTSVILSPLFWAKDLLRYFGCNCGSVALCTTTPESLCQNAAQHQRNPLHSGRSFA